MSGTRRQDRAGRDGTGLDWPWAMRYVGPWKCALHHIPSCREYPDKVCGRDHDGPVTAGARGSAGDEPRAGDWEASVGGGLLCAPPLAHAGLYPGRRSASQTCVISWRSTAEVRPSRVVEKAYGWENWQSKWAIVDCTSMSFARTFVDETPPPRALKSPEPPRPAQN